MPEFEKELETQTSQQFLFSWHERPGAFVRLNPPWRPVKIIKSSGSIKNGSIVTLQLPWLPMYWTLRHEGYVFPDLFEDRQVKGPFLQWRHKHAFSSVAGTAKLRDHIDYKLPIPGISYFFDKELESLFAYRHGVTGLDVVRHQKDETNKKMRILITGSSGMIGQQLCAFFLGGGHEVVSLGRKVPEVCSSHIFWDFKNEVDLHPQAIGKVDAVINLLGSNIADGRWTEKRKKELVDSRVSTTKNLCSALIRDANVPEVFISASATGFYGDRKDRILDDEASRGDGFLTDLAKDWEEATSELEKIKVRVVHARFGVVITGQGGALKKMLLPFLMGLGAQLGNGKQWMSWISLEDLIGSILLLLRSPGEFGAYNICSPEPIQNSYFTRSLAKVIKRPAIFRLPKAIVRLLFGEMGEQTLLSGQRAIPKKLLAAGYIFEKPKIEDALRFTLGK